VYSLLQTIKRRKGLDNANFAALLVTKVDGRRISIHVVYVGPEVDEIPSLWRKISVGDQVSIQSISFVAEIMNVLAFRLQSPAMAATTEAALNGVRRVRALGAVYGDREGEQEKRPPERCPFDDSELRRICGLQTLEYLELHGYRELWIARREAAAARREAAAARREAAAARREAAAAREAPLGTAA
jgi:hypothetical protein